MSILNNRFQLALLKRKRSGNALQKGFTLVELMIVIVIVGILSAVALPNFLNQTGKAKATEAKTKVSSLLKQTSAESLESNITTAVSAANTANTGPVAVATAAGAWTYTMTAGTGVILITAAPTANGTAAGTTNVQGCVNPTTGATQVVQQATALTTC